MINRLVVCLDNEISFKKRAKLVKNASMIKWWDAVKFIDIPMPKTVIVKLTEDEKAEILSIYHGNKLSDATLSKLEDEADKIGYPLFMRTDQTSCKHDWEDTCFIESDAVLKYKLRRLMEENSTLGMIGLPVDAIVFREYIPMATVFKAFHGMPVNPERRFFAKNGKIICNHAYWVEPAIRFRKGTEEPPDWKEKLAVINADLEGEELELLIGQVKIISKSLTNELGGAWSIDFCKGADGVWYFIDTAPMEVSWHPPHEEELKKMVEERNAEVEEWKKALEEMGKMQESKQGKCRLCDRTSVKPCSYCGEPFCVANHLMQRGNEFFCYDCDTGVASVDDEDSKSCEQGEL